MPTTMPKTARYTLKITTQRKKQPLRVDETSRCYAIYGVHRGSYFESWLTESRHVTGELALRFGKRPMRFTLQEAYDVLAHADLAHGASFSFRIAHTNSI